MGQGFCLPSDHETHLAPLDSSMHASKKLPASSFSFPSLLPPNPKLLCFVSSGGGGKAAEGGMGQLIWCIVNPNMKELFFSVGAGRFLIAHCYLHRIVNDQETRVSREVTESTAFVQEINPPLKPGEAFKFSRFWFRPVRKGNASCNHNPVSAVGSAIYI